MWICHILVLFLVFSIIPAFAQGSPDYYKPYAPIFTDRPMYSWTEKVTITILAPSWNENRNGIDTIGSEQSHFIKISTGDHFLKPYKLAETGPNTGKFVGEVTLTGFSHDADGDGSIDTTPRTSGNGPTNGFLETKRDGAITISFKFADDVVLTESALISWALGEVSFVENPSTSSQKATIRVVDRDMNLNPESIDQVRIKITSDSDAAGILVDGIENSEDSGLFLATVFFTQTLESSGNRLFAKPGDTIYAIYDDHTLPPPYTVADDLEIIAQSDYKLNVPPLDRLVLEDLYISNSIGAELQEFNVDDQLQIVGQIQNQLNFGQEFVFLFQILDQEGLVVSLSWIKGELQEVQNLQVSQSWVPKESGSYTIEAFVWDSLESSIPLAPPFSKEITIQ